jgi:bifunctional DNase/RNase
VFYADLSLDVSGKEVHVSSRPSDAIALAVRTGTPVFAAASVLDDAGVVFEEDEEEEEDEVARFREFLEDATIEDFLGGEQAE